MRSGAPFLLGALVLAAGCAASREPPLDPIGAVPMTLRLEEEGPWREVAPPASGETAGPPAPRRPDPVPAPVPAPRPVPAVLRTPLPEVRGAARPVPPGRSPEVLARERFLDHPTRIRAARITLYCPPAYLAEVRLRADRVEEPRPGRRVATGSARLLLRELTLEGERIVLRTRERGASDLQITARGGVSFVSRQGEHVLHEEGLRSLIVTNDEVVPLR